MSTMEAEGGDDGWLREQLEALDGTIRETGQGDAFDAFVNFYNELPEHRMNDTLGGDLVVEHEVQGNNLELRPIAPYGSALIARDIKGPLSSQDVPSLYIIRGSFVIPEEDLEQLGDAAVLSVANPIAHRGEQIITNVSEGPASGLRIAYLPDKFCREGRLMIAKVHTMEGLRAAEIRSQTAAKPLNGAMITVQPKPNQPQTLFMEADFTLTRKVKNVYWRVGNAYQPLLSYIDR